MLEMKESEVPKFLAEELSKEPFNLNLNLISFTSLQGDALMRIFQSVLADIQPNLQEVLAMGNPGDKMQAMIELLRVLKLWPKCFEQHTVTTALENVNPEIIWDMMGWLLTRKDELKTRAYLSQFLVKVPVPDEFMLDPEVQQCYEEYESKIGEFKGIHKRLEEIRTHKGISELVSDLKDVEREVDSCSRKLDMMKCNVREIAQDEEYLQLAKELRQARTEKNRLTSQAYMEERKLWNSDKKSYVLSNKLHEIQELNSHSSPEGVLERAEQDCEIMKFIVHHKIPQDVDEAEKKILSMEAALTLAPEFPSDLDATRVRLHETRKEIQELDKSMQSQEGDASLTFARQKATQNKKKKLQLFEELEEVRKDMLEHQSSLREKREQRKKLFPEGIPCLSTRDYKEYVKTMKVKAAKYKSMRAELSALQTEISVMSTTKLIVEEEFRSSIEELKKLEEQFGLIGFSCVHERIGSSHNGLDQSDEGKIRYIYEMSEKARELQERVKAKKADIEPLSNGVIEAKQEIKALDLHKKRLENSYEIEMGPVKESNDRMETRSTKIKEEIIKNQEDICRLRTEIPILITNMQRAVVEAEFMKGASTNSGSFRNRMLTRIVDQERLQKTLKLEMTELEQCQANAIRQSEMWSNLKSILEAKVELLNGPTSSD